MAKKSGDRKRAPAAKPTRQPPLTAEQRGQMLNDMLARYANQLGEHFTSVQIIATHLEPDGGTQRYNKGSGDYYARMGAVREWVRTNDRAKDAEEDDDE